MRTFIKNILPPFLFSIIRNHYNSRFTGDYTNWEEACKKAGGYDADEIINKVEQATSAVVNGKAVFERDSVLFDKIEYSWPLLAALMWMRAQETGEFNVVDFGGALGSTYYQNKKFLDGITELTWNIVEQEKFIEIGKKKFETGRLKFFPSIQKCSEYKRIDAIILSSVITYLEEPYSLLQEIVDKKIKNIILDRTFILKENKRGGDVITLQKVPSRIYNASYPCWLLDESKLLSFFQANNYSLIESFDAIDGESKRFYSKGYIFNLND